MVVNLKRQNQNVPLSYFHFQKLYFIVIINTRATNLREIIDDLHKI